MGNYPAGVTNSMIERQCLADDEVQCKECQRVMSINNADLWIDIDGVGTLCTPCAVEYDSFASDPEDGR
jgi:hypothetical protein